MTTFKKSDKEALINMAQTADDLTDALEATVEPDGRSKIGRMLNQLSLNLTALLRKRDEYKALRAEMKARNEEHKDAQKKSEILEILGSVKKAEKKDRHIIQLYADLIEPDAFGNLNPDLQTANIKKIKRLMQRYPTFAEFRKAIMTVKDKGNKKIWDEVAQTRKKPDLFPEKIAGLHKQLKTFLSGVQESSYISRVNSSCFGHPELFAEIVNKYWEELKDGFQYSTIENKVRDDETGKKVTHKVNVGVICRSQPYRAKISRKGLTNVYSKEIVMDDEGCAKVKQITKTGRETEYDKDGNLKSFDSILELETVTQRDVHRDSDKTVAAQDGFWKSWSWKFQAKRNKLFGAFATKQQLKEEAYIKAKKRAVKIETIGTDTGIDMLKVKAIVQEKTGDSWTTEGKWYDRMLKFAPTTAKLQKYNGLKEAIEKRNNDDLILAFAGDLVHKTNNWKA